MLKLYVRKGMRVDEVQKIISFKQSEWLEKHISFIAENRNEAIKDSEKGFHELLNNAFFGKTMENVRK